MLQDMLFRKSLIVFLLTSSLFVSLPAPAYAEEGDTKPTEQSWVYEIINNREIIPAGCAYGRQETRDKCGVAEMIQTLVNITRLILGVMGSIALLVFVWGGLQFIIAGGDIGTADKPGKVQKAKKTIVNAVIGIVLILTSWLFINFVVSSLTQGREGIGEPATIFKDKPITAPPEK